MPVSHTVCFRNSASRNTFLQAGDIQKRTVYRAEIPNLSHRPELWTKVPPTSVNHQLCKCEDTSRAVYRTSKDGLRTNTDNKLTSHRCHTKQREQLELHHFATSAIGWALSVCDDASSYGTLDGLWCWKPSSRWDRRFHRDGRLCEHGV